MGNLFRVLLLVHDEGKTKTQCCESIDGSRPCEVLITWFRFWIIKYIRQNQNTIISFLLFSKEIETWTKIENAVWAEMTLWKRRLMRHVDMSTLMLPAATITTMTNTSPIAVAQPKTDSVKGTLMLNNNNNKQGRRIGQHGWWFLYSKGIKWFSSLWSTPRKYFPVVVVKGLWNGWKEIKMPKKFQRISLLDSKNLNIGKQAVYKNWDKKLEGNQNLKGWLQERRLDQNSNFRALLYASYTPHASYTHSKSKNPISPKNKFRERLFLQPLPKPGLSSSAHLVSFLSLTLRPPSFCDTSIFLPTFTLPWNLKVFN